MTACAFDKTHSTYLQHSPGQNSTLMESGTRKRGGVHVGARAASPRFPMNTRPLLPCQTVLARDTIVEPDSPFVPFVLTGSENHFTVAVLVNQARGIHTHTCYNTRGGMSRQDVLLDQHKAWTATKRSWSGSPCLSCASIRPIRTCHRSLPH